MESLLELRKRFSQSGNDADNAEGTGSDGVTGTATVLVKKIKIVSSDGTLKYNFADESGPPPPSAVNRGKPIITHIKGSAEDEYYMETKPVVSNRNPFVIRIETPRSPVQSDQHFQNVETKVVYIKSDQQQINEESYPVLPQDDIYPSHSYAAVRQRRCQSRSFTDDEVREAYTKLQLKPPDCPYEEMNDSERGIYRFVRRRLMNKNSARQSRLRRKQLFKEYENTIQMQMERIERSENRLRLLFTCFINSVTLIALQSMPDLVKSSDTTSLEDALQPEQKASSDCPNCQRSLLFGSAVLDAIHTFGPSIYDDMEGIDQLIVDLRICGVDRPVKQLLQRQERSIINIFNSSGIKDTLGNIGIPQWKLSILISKALRSAWSIFLSADDQALLFEETNDQTVVAKQEPEISSSAYFESFVRELFDPVKHAEIIDAINGDSEPPDPRA